MTSITIVNQTQGKLCLCFTAILVSVALKLPLIRKVSTSPKSKKSLLRLSVSDDEQLSTRNNVTFLEKLSESSMSLFHQMLFCSHYTHNSLYHYILLF